MQELHSLVRQARDAMAERLAALNAAGGMSEDQYVRYLSMQYHLTKDVQRVFMIAASHPDFSSRRALRDYLFRIGIEEEPHFRIAEEDVQGLGRSLVEMPLDLRLWHAHFNALIHDRPLVRIGAHCVLENIVVGLEEKVMGLLSQAPFVTRQTSRFVVLHTHADAPHGQDIFRVLEAAKLDARHLADLVEGARDGGTMFLRLIDWSVSGCALGSPAGRGEAEAPPASAPLAVANA
ncbi:hypothetical protein AY600_14140 [Phormidium willei BDU 130791]|nr:hypothetical protein AY600_14140 [Phormidium willei BDU 130791]